MIEFEKPTISKEVSEDGKYGKFTVQPLQRGYGTTLGNAMRRIRPISTNTSTILRTITSPDSTISGWRNARTPCSGTASRTFRHSRNIPYSILNPPIETGHGFEKIQKKQTGLPGSENGAPPHPLRRRACRPHRLRAALRTCNSRISPG